MRKEPSRIVPVPSTSGAVVGPADRRLQMELALRGQSRHERLGRL